RLKPPVLHRRWVFSLKSEFCLVRDCAEGRGQHQLDIFWHLNPELFSRAENPDTFLQPDGMSGLCIITAGDGWSRQLARAWWSSGGWSGDAEFFYWRRNRGGALWSIIMCNGTYLELAGERLFSCSRPVLRCEIIRTGEKMHILCSDNEALTVNDSLRNLWEDF